MSCIGLFWTVLRICSAAPSKPAIYGTEAGVVVQRDFSCPDGVAQEAFTTIGYYSDARCQSLLQQVTYTSCPNFPAGEATCDASNIDLGSRTGTIYGMVLASSGVYTQADLTRDQVCPPGGADAVLKTFSAGSDTCVMLGDLTGNEGMAIYPAGGSMLAKRTPVEAKQLAGVLGPRDEQHCSGFNFSSSVNTFSPSKQVSDIIDCRNSAQPCAISSSVQHTTSISSSYSFATGETVVGTSASTNFGRNYADSVYSSVQDAWEVPVNQAGYLSVYSLAVLFTGNFVGCHGGNTEGKILALRSGMQVYHLVLTSG